MKTELTISKSQNIALRKKKTKDGYSLYLDVHFDGKRKKEYLKLYLTGNKNEDKKTILFAEEIKAKRLLELKNRKHGFSTSYENAKILTYIKNLSERTQNLKYGVFALISYAGEDVKFSDITADFLYKYKEYLKSTYSNNTASGYYSMLKYIIRSAIKENIIEKNDIFVTSSIARQNTNRIHLEIEEIVSLSKNILQNHKSLCDAFLFSCFTGLRLSDIHRLTWSNVQKDSLVFQQKKTKLSIVIPISEQARKYLPDQINEGKIFDIPIQPIFLLKSWAKKAELHQEISFHTARHTFATLALSNDVDIYTVSKLLGHTDIKTTMIYAKLVDKKLYEAVDKLPTF